MYTFGVVGSQESVCMMEVGMERSPFVIQGGVIIWLLFTQGQTIYYAIVCTILQEGVPSYMLQDSCDYGYKIYRLQWLIRKCLHDGSWKASHFLSVKMYQSSPSRSFVMSYNNYV